jgi:hypothetical protein
MLRNSKLLIPKNANMETMQTLRSNIDGQGIKRDDQHGHIKKESRNKGKKARAGGREFKAAVWKVVEKETSKSQG